VFLCVAECGRALQLFQYRINMQSRVSSEEFPVAVRCNALQCVAVGCSVLQYVAVCCSMLQYVAVCCSVL